VQRKKTNKVFEGNLYNTETQIAGNPEPTKTGLEQWKIEVLKQLYGSLKRKNIPNIDQVLKSVFGETLR